MSTHSNTPAHVPAASGTTVHPPPPPAKAPPQVKPKPVPPVVDPVPATWAEQFAARNKELSRVAPEDITSQYKTATANQFKNVTNPRFDWLTYESIFNYPVFQRTNERLPMGAYSIPLKDLRIILCSSATEETITQLRQAFFPGLANDEALKSILYQPWRSGTGAYDPAAGQKLSSDAAKRVGLAHMPYNVLSNDPSSHALGTWAKPDGNPELVKLPGEWPMWQTASRSCVMKLDSTVRVYDPARKPVTKQETNPDTHTPVHTLDWDFSRQPRDYTPFPSNIPHTARAPLESLRPTAEDPAMYFGVKSGVVYVGGMKQGSKDVGEKWTLEKEAIAAALRSEYITLLQSGFLKGFASPLMGNIIIVPEILTVTCTNKNIDDGACDGFQLRDIRPLDSTMKYFPPLSIPFIGITASAAAPIDFVKCATAWAAVELLLPAQPIPPVRESDWVNYWGDHFAARIGQAKAILHLVYGLQPLTPNSQNFLLEYTSAMQPTGRVVVRDILDMKLHTDWVQTVLGPSVAGKKGDAVSVSLTEHTLNLSSATPELQKLLKFEATVPSPNDSKHPLMYDSETFLDKRDAVNRIQYFKDTQINYFAYTSLYKGSQVESSSVLSPMGPAPKGWQEILLVTTLWGFIHAVNYITIVNDELGLKIPSDFNTLNTLPLDFGAADASVRARSEGVKFLSTPGATAGTWNEVVVPEQASATDNVPFQFFANAYSIRKLEDTAEGRQRAGALQLLYEQWDRRVSGIIHHAIYGTYEGREALRKFHGLT